MAGKNGKTSRADNPDRDPLAREFAPRRNAIDVHNERLARDKRARKRDKNGFADAEKLAIMRKTAERYRKFHPSTLHDVPDAFRNDKELRMNYEGVEMRLGLKDDPEDQE